MDMEMMDRNVLYFIEGVFKELLLRIHKDI